MDAVYPSIVFQHFGNVIAVTTCLTRLVPLESQALISKISSLSLLSHVAVPVRPRPGLGLCLDLGLGPVECGLSHVYYLT